ncbi:MAG: hypothetical protein KAU91_07235, partial [Candidatus Aminicenantes bacterium]|nr:hypothetical protein [Candidatus Aminicenantes bacterium]
MNKQKKDIFWFILLRLIIITTLVVSAVIIQFSTSIFLPLSLFYYLILFTYFLSFIYIILYYWGRYLSFLVYLQIFFDLFLITALVYFSGGLTGSFYFLYIFEIIAASIVISKRAAYLTAAFSAIFFGLLVNGMYLGALPNFSSDTSTEISLGLVINNIFIAWSVFFLVAFLINYMTERLRKTGDELRLAQKELEIKKRLAVAGEFSAQLAHEIRNPLAAISGSVQVLRDELDLADEQKSLMDIVVDESKRASQSIEQFLSFASPGEQTFSWVNLSAVLDETLTLLQRGGEFNGNCRVEGNYRSSEVRYFGNANQFKQIFWNLLKNSLKAMPEGGTLAIDFTQEKKGGVRLRFVDTGMGMLEEDKKRIFE